MSAFYVGQRVRIVSVDYAESLFLVGREGVVNKLDCINDLDKTGYTGVTVAGDANWCFLPHQLEPISDSNQLVSWESMRDLWVPEHLREAA